MYGYMSSKDVIVDVNKEVEMRTNRKRKWRVKGEYTPFPPPAVPSKVDIQLETGEYFLGARQRRLEKMRARNVDSLDF